ncbi:hypothetical protein KEM48_007139 [Puccinia striiformis f. sp. tritici PST-130]|nr:hypothetical protein KEM48_007139 [Puccinia striiformis f. sp. tritici PST-130]
MSLGVITNCLRADPAEDHEVQQDGQQTSFEGMTDIEIESLPGEQDFDIDSVDMREVINIFHPSAPDKREEDGDGEQGEEEGDDDKGGVDDGDDTDGFMHNILSRMQYDKVRALMGLLGLNLLHWTSIWRAKAKLRAMLNMEPLRRESVFKNQCYSLSIKRTTALDLANPYVNPHLDYYPVDSAGLNMHKMSQSWEWRCKLKAKCIKPETTSVPNDPNFKIIIPKYLRYDSPKVLSIDCEEFSLNYSEICLWGGLKLTPICKNTPWELYQGKLTPTAFPNPWRAKADGQIMRHVPITLYCDDTSGNQSKKWNKHISYYYTLSGLPPKVSNQQYNCHFLSTSNTAGTLELADQIVDELNDITTNGFIAFDYGLQQEVLVITSVVMCFLGDSPMHAEITNTPLPGSSLNPCRICHLGVEKRKDKSGEDYIYQLLAMDS